MSGTRFDTYSEGVDALLGELSGGEITAEAVVGHENDSIIKSDIENTLSQILPSPRDPFSSGSPTTPLESTSDSDANGHVNGTDSPIAALDLADPINPATASKLPPEQFDDLLAIEAPLGRVPATGTVFSEDALDIPSIVPCLAPCLAPPEPLPQTNGDDHKIDERTRPAIGADQNRQSTADQIPISQASLDFINSFIDPSPSADVNVRNAPGIPALPVPNAEQNYPPPQPAEISKPEGYVHHHGADTALQLNPEAIDPGLSLCRRSRPVINQARYSEPNFERPVYADLNKPAKVIRKPSRAKTPSTPSTLDAHAAPNPVARVAPKRKPRTYSQPVPSQHCHICSRRPTETSPHAACGNLFKGKCRKTICQKCFTQYGWNIEEARNASISGWVCPHCAGRCPERAQCHIYDRTSERRRNNAVNHRKPKKVVPGTNSATKVAAAARRAPLNVVPPAANRGATLGSVTSNCTPVHKGRIQKKAPKERIVPSRSNRSAAPSGAVLPGQAEYKRMPVAPPQGRAFEAALGDSQDRDALALAPTSHVMPQQPSQTHQSADSAQALFDLMQVIDASPQSIQSIAASAAAPAPVSDTPTAALGAQVGAFAEGPFTDQLRLDALCGTPYHVEPGTNSPWLNVYDETLLSVAGISRDGHASNFERTV